MGITGIARVTAIISVAFALTGCEDGAKFNPFAGKGKTTTTADGTVQTTTNEDGATVIEREVEAPEVFQTQEKGLWDGRPSLGGVWVAHPDVTDPERVTIRNLDNGKTVVGALFRRERDNPGPRLQISSDAARELGVLAGKPTAISVVAMKRETITVAPEVPEPTAAPADDKIEAQPLQSVESIAAAAIAASEKPAAGAKPAAAAKPASAGALEKPFVQLGIFSTEGSAKEASAKLSKAGIIGTIKPFKSKGKSYWRLIAGPVTSKTARQALLKKVKGLGFKDAYPVTN